MEILGLHWLRPYWLFMLPLVWLAAINAWRAHRAGGDWAKIAEPHLLKFLGSGESGRGRHLLNALITLCLSLALFALAGPAWEKAASGSFSANQARVVVLDLSRSMLAEDVKPSRIAQARFKLMDLLDQVTEGQVGLVAYAGQAFVIAPLSSDMETIKNMVPALQPDIMPAPGSRPDEALSLAADLIHQAGFNRGEIILIADSSNSRAITKADELSTQGIRVSVLAIGTDQGAPIPSGRGFIKGRDGQIVVSRLDARQLQATAKSGGGDYFIARADNSELADLLGQGDEDYVAVDENKNSGIEQRWLDQGYWLVLLLLPLILLVFRKGWFFVLPIFLLAQLQPLWVAPVYAQPYAHEQVKKQVPPQQPLSQQSPPGQSVPAAVVEPMQQKIPAPATTAKAPGIWQQRWNKLWFNADQRAQQALQQQRYEAALEIAKSGNIQAEAAYRQADYARALEQWQVEEAEAKVAEQKASAAYNQGNAHAAAEDIEAAIADYQRALSLVPDMADAQTNLDILKKLQDQQNQDGDNKDKSEQGEGNDQQDQQGDDQQQQDQQQQDAENSDQQPQDSEQNSDDQDQDQAEEQQQDQQQDQQQQEDQQSAEEQAAQMTQEEQWTEEDEQAKEQWLRRIPDDPGGLLRRKLIQEYKRRNRQEQSNQPW